MENITATVIRQSVQNNNSKNVKLDETCKLLLSNSQILAHILKYTVDELKYFSRDEIQQILPTKVKQISVFPGDTINPETVDKKESESGILGENLVKFDVRVDLEFKDPITNESKKIRIDIEVQNDLNKSYNMVTRGIAYSGRMLSQQFGDVVRKSRYENLEKVYSIWILPQSKMLFDGMIKRYTIDETIIEGEYDLDYIKDQYGTDLNDKNIYDKINVTTIQTYNQHNVDSKYKNNDVILRPILLLFGNSINDYETIKKILVNDYGFMMTEKIEKEVKEMCNLSEGLLYQGKQEGEEKKAIEVAFNLLKNTDFNFKKIAELVGLKNDREINRVRIQMLKEFSNNENIKARLLDDVDGKR